MFGYNESGLPETIEDVNKGKMAHVTIMEIAKTNGEWGIVKDSRFNKRFTPDTPINVVGPRGSELLKQPMTLRVQPFVPTQLCNGRTPK